MRIVFNINAIVHGDKYPPDLMKMSEECCELTFTDRKTGNREGVKGSGGRLLACRCHMQQQW